MMSNERFIICKASAGAGKTYTLVRQFIEIAISSPSQLKERFRHILAITFTNKAANGMKSRIMSQLSKITSNSHDTQGLVSEMASHLGITCDETVHRCSVLLSAVLHGYSDFSVCTIDSFVLRLVRTFAHELRLPVNFDVLIDNQELLKSSVDELFARLGTSYSTAQEKPGGGTRGLTKIMCAFAESRMEDGRNYDLSRQIVELSGEIFKEDTAEFLDKLDKFDFSDFLETEQELRRENRKFEEELSKAAQIAIEACDAHNLTVEDFPYKGSGVYGWFDRFAKGDYKAINTPSARVEKAMESGVLYAKSASPTISDAIIAATPDMILSYNKIQSLLATGRAMYNTRRMLLINIHTLALLNIVRKIKDQYYHQNERVHISEFNKRIAASVMDEPTPFIYERIGSRYYNYLIDEFQDTSKLQWQNFLPLLDEAMTHRFANDTAPVGMQSLVVGDGKQAIYRFRQGDVRQFIKLPQVESRLHGRSLMYNSHTVDLKQNFRTQFNIVDFNNRFFRWAVENHFSDNEELTNLYLRDSLEQKAVKQGGYVQLTFLHERLYENILDAILHQVVDLHYSYRDIMLLARDNKTLCEISNCLTAAAIPVVSSESFILSNSRVVLLLVAALKCLHNPDDRVAALQVSQLASELSVPRPGGEPFKAVPFGTELLRAVPFKAVPFGTAIYDCCEELLRYFCLQGRDTAYVASFLNVVNTFSNRPGAASNDLGTFIAWIDEHLETLSCSTSSGLDAVRLMTIHKAKGLESKIVICAFPAAPPHQVKMWVQVPLNASTAGGGTAPETPSGGTRIPVAYVTAQKNESLFSEDFASEERLCDMDSINLLYVALTRAEEKLLVFCHHPQGSAPKGSAPGRGSGIAPTLLHEFAASDNFTIGEDCPSSATALKGSSPNGTALKGSAPGPAQMIVQNVVFPQWEERIAIARTNSGGTSVQAPNRLGIMIHEILSHIRTVDDIVPVVTSFSVANYLNESDKESIVKRIMDMIGSEDNSRFFAAGVKVLCEASMVVGGQVRRPDRIVFEEDNVWVVDFKTGRRDDMLHEMYKQQVADYAQALEGMGYRNVHTRILYL